MLPSTKQQETRNRLFLLAVSRKIEGKKSGDVGQAAFHPSTYILLRIDAHLLFLGKD